MRHWPIPHAAKAAGHAARSIAGGESRVI